MKMKRLCIAAVFVLMLASTAANAVTPPPEIVGKWVGRIDTDHGQMEIGLELAEEKGKLVGEVKTAHGGWKVTGVTEKDGAWTITFSTGDAEGRMTGRIADGRFAGEWKSHMASGTFTLVRPKKKG